MSTDTPTVTTGESLGKFFNELVAAGLPIDAAAEIVRDTAREVTQGGIFSVRGETANV